MRTGINGDIIYADVDISGVTVARTVIDLDDELVASVAKELGTSTKKDTVNAALREVGQRLVRLRALARLGEMADAGDFDEFLGDKASFRP